MPKHKGTDHHQAEVKSRIKELTDELRAPGKGKRAGPSRVLRPEGAAQIALLGPPNTGIVRRRSGRFRSCVRTWWKSTSNEEFQVHVGATQNSWIVGERGT